jgi:hypothetical protein
MSPCPPCEGRQSLDDADQPSRLRVHLCVAVPNRSSLEHFVVSFPSLGTRRTGHGVKKHRLRCRMHDLLPDRAATTTMLPA